MKAVLAAADAAADPRFELLFDPQTAGGFLCGVPEAKRERFLAGLAASEVEAAPIGVVRPKRPDGAVARIRVSAKEAAP